MIRGCGCSGTSGRGFAFLKGLGCTEQPSFRGASKASEPGIHNHHREYGFRVCAKEAHPGMTKSGGIISLSFRGASKASEPGIHNHHREYGFRVCAKAAHPGMTKGGGACSV